MIKSLELIKDLADHIIISGCTVRQAASFYGFSKSYVHRLLVVDLPEIDPVLYSCVRTILDKNKKERSIRGGLSTKSKYAKIRDQY